MTTLIYSLIIGTLASLLVHQYLYRRRIVKTSSRLISNQLSDHRRLKERFDELQKNYNALEEGNQEIVDNYENDFLDFKQQIETAKNSAAYDREAREKVEAELERMNLIIEQHSNKCDTIVEDIAHHLINELLPEDIMEDNKLVHNHPSSERCDKNGCTTDRYVDGEHVFTDKTVVTSPADEEKPADE
jgi:hypothetical protein